MDNSNTNNTTTPAAIVFHAYGNLAAAQVYLGSVLDLNDVEDTVQKIRDSYALIMEPNVEVGYIPELLAMALTSATLADFMRVGRSDDILSLPVLGLTAKLQWGHSTRETVFDIQPHAELKSSLEEAIKNKSELVPVVLRLIREYNHSLVDLVTLASEQLRPPHP